MITAPTAMAATGATQAGAVPATAQAAPKWPTPWSIADVVNRATAVSSRRSASSPGPWLEIWGMRSVMRRTHGIIAARMLRSDALFTFGWMDSLCIIVK